MTKKGNVPDKKKEEREKVTPILGTHMYTEKKLLFLLPPGK